MKSYWFKAKCLICPREVFQLCPPKRNLEANLMTHVHGVVHNKTLQDFNNEKMAWHYPQEREGVLAEPQRPATSLFKHGCTHSSSELMLRFSPMKECLFVHELVGV